MPSESLLMLDRSTLFYWTLSDTATSQKKRKHAFAIQEWALTVPATAKPTSKAPSSLAKSNVPSLTSGTSRSSAPSVLTDNVKITSHRQALDSVKVKAEPSPTLSLHNDGGLSDNDKMRGKEREAAIKSRPKGKKRVTSEVSLLRLI